MTVVRWKHPNSDKIAWLDYIPSEWAMQDGHRKNLRHLSLWNERSRVTCYCDVEVNGREMTISYDSDQNYERNAKEFSPGRSTLFFEDDERVTPLPSVQWQEGEEAPKSLGEIVYDEGLGLEGATKIRQHKTRERQSGYAKLAKDKRLAETGQLACEACTFDFCDRYGGLGFGYIEAHHDEVLAGGERITSVDDFSIVCSNCHRMIHKSETVGKMLTVADLRKLLNDVKAGLRSK